MEVIKKGSKRLLVVFLLFSLCLSLFATEKEDLSSWTKIVEKMEIRLNNAYELYTQGKTREAYDEVNAAYFRYYESKGMEKITMSYLSGARKTAVENAFYEYRKNVKSDKDSEMIRAHKDALIAMLYHDAAELDGTSNDKGESGKSAAVATFISCFVLVLREGLEAILVIAAIIAYLVKTGKKKYISSVYIGALAGILVSILLAFLFGLLADAQSGIAQEVFEGIGMFVAVIVLFYVSNWMISKSETEAWERYIQKKVESSVSTGNKWVLIFAAFIAVAREGAELILFFQGVPVQGASGQRAMILAVVLSVVILAGVFLAFRFLSVKLPLKPFFTVTSILMYILCFSFTGKGVSELQAAGVVSKTIIPWMQSFELDFLGIYATYESLIPQIIVLVAIIVFSSLYVKKNKKILAELKKKEGENN
ncbi:FTR1 family iron permease [Treponema putidum]|uniref:FTR1 family iron permease n=1 Tax=Treponema putidum TaxID=221027 RepID=A0AAE9SHZ3_9SPIR|nr:FTR1 family protein [Treponema putidum]UTY33555.1 FTR1 family iron permease [Treponema putidum]